MRIRMTKISSANFLILPYYLILLIPSYLLFINYFTHCQGHTPKEKEPVIANLVQYGLKFLFNYCSYF